ncbi:MAG TPA: integrase, partial [Xanthobacteraceae bacterium]|nr:integrase [Xanthobacteraceae bacterium]
MQHVRKITKKLVDGMRAGEIIWDDVVRGFGVRRQVRAKSFIVKASIKGRQRFVTIGVHGAPW